MKQSRASLPPASAGRRPQRVVEHAGDDSLDLSGMDNWAGVCTVQS